MDINKWLEDASNEMDRKNRNISNEYEPLRQNTNNGWRHQHAKLFSSGKRVKRYKNVKELRESYLKRKKEERENFHDTRIGNSKFSLKKISIKNSKQKFRSKVF